MTKREYRKRRNRSLITKILLNQMGLTIFFVMLQIMAIGFGTYAGVIYIWQQSQVWFWLLIITLGIDLLLRIILTIVTLNRQIDPYYKIVWLTVISLFPLLGSFLYLFIKIIPNAQVLARKLEKRIEETRPLLKQDERIEHQLNQTIPTFTSLARYLNNAAVAPTFQNVDLTYYPLGDDVYPAMLSALEKAEKFIFLEYFIITPGIMWENILAILLRKVAAGVEVRLMYDGFNTFTSLPRNYYLKLRKLGIKCRVFAPVKAVISSYQNNRDHRKMMIIDGRVGFLGGINIGDEYINQYLRFGHWKDVGLRLEGSAVNALTAQFMTMWSIKSKHPLQLEKYLVTSPLVSEEVNNFVIPYADAPENNVNTGENVYLAMLGQARKYYHIITPYLILNERLLQELLFSAKSGVEIIIIMPAVPDKKIPFWVARSYYHELIKAGIKIYEYTPGFAHAKVVISDDQVFTIGSFNFDFRSLYLNYENGVFAYDPAMAQIIEADFQQTLAVSEIITVEKIATFSLCSRMIGRVMRIFETLF